MDLTFIEDKVIPTGEATIPVTSLAFTLSGSVFEALRVNWNEEKGQYYLPNVDKNVRRLFNSMKILKMTPSFSKEYLLESLFKLIKEWDQHTDAYVRITAYIFDFSHNGSVFNPTEVTTKLAINISDRPWKTSLNSPITCQVSSWTRISDNCLPPRVKSASNYENTRLAGHDAIQNGFDNAILLNSMGKVSEAAESAIFIVDENGLLITPSLQSDVLDSINRSSIIKMYELMTGVQVEERIVDRTELYLASEVFICNTAKLIRPVVGIDHIQIGQGSTGCVTKKIADEYDLVLRGKNKLFDDDSRLLGGN